MRNDEEDGTKPIDVGLRIPRFIGLRAVGFKRNHGTTDHQIRFDSYIRNAFAKKKNTLLPLSLICKKLTTPR